MNSLWILPDLPSSIDETVLHHTVFTQCEILRYEASWGV
jgi:hypothetical protein